jgi:hypothetical protein
MTHLSRFICFLWNHRWAGPRRRYTFCLRCRTNIYTGGLRGR